MFAYGSLLDKRILTAADASVYTATLATEISLITVANINGSAATFRLFHRDGPGAFELADVLYWNYTVGVGETFTFNSPAQGSGITLLPGEQLGARASGANVLVLHVYGVTERVTERG